MKLNSLTREALTEKVVSVKYLKEVNEKII